MTGRTPGALCSKSHASREKRMIAMGLLSWSPRGATTRVISSTLAAAATSAVGNFSRNRTSTGSILHRVDGAGGQEEESVPHNTLGFHLQKCVHADILSNLNRLDFAVQNHMSQLKFRNSTHAARNDYHVDQSQSRSRAVSDVV